MSDRQSFNLIDEPWIRVTDLDGAEEVVSLAELFQRAHELRRLAGELPTQDFAVLRVLLAILYRAIGTAKPAEATDDWQQLWDQATLPWESIAEYLEQWRARFDLIDGERPFYQVPDLRNEKGDWRGLELIVPDSDPDGALFTMRSRLDSLELAEAARWLIHAQAYDMSGIKSGAVGDPRVKGGKGYPMGTGWCGWLGGTWLEGRTLRETLLLNLVLDRQPRLRADVPIWEEEPLTSRERDPDARGPHGQLSLLTWPQRRIRLRVDGGRARSVLVSNGDPIDYTVQHQRELMSGWRLSEPQTKKAKEIRYMPRALEPGRSLWRGLSSLLPHGGTATTKTPFGTVASSLPAGVLAWAGTLVHAGALPQDYPIEVRVVSMLYGTQSASYADLLDDRLRFAAALAAIEGEELRGTAVEGVRRAEDAAYAVRELGSGLAQAAGGEHGPEGAKAERVFYAALDREFPAWLATLRVSADAAARLTAWTELLRREATDAARTLISGASPASWSGRTIAVRGGDAKRVISVATAARRFEWLLRRALDAAHPGPPSADELADSKTDGKDRS